MEAQVAGHVDATSEEVEAWTKLSALILDACAEHFPSLTTTDGDAFRARLLEFKSKLVQAPSPSEVLVSAGSITQAIEEHGALIAKRLSAAQEGMRGIAGSLAQHIESIYFGNPASTNLATLRGKWESAGSDVLPALREQLLNLLMDLEKGHPKSQLKASSKAPSQSGADSVDPNTGLPLRADSEVAIQRALENPANYSVAIFYVHRMNLTNSRFGEAIGNQVILFCSQHIASRLTRGEDALFRWMGPAFVALLNRKESDGSVVSEVQRVASTPLSRFFETSTRTVYLPMKLSGDAFPLTGKSYAEVMERLEKFIGRASQTLE